MLGPLTPSVVSVAGIAGIAVVGALAAAQQLQQQAHCPEEATGQVPGGSTSWPTPEADMEASAQLLGSISVDEIYDQRSQMALTSIKTSKQVAGLVTAVLTGAFSNFIWLGTRCRTLVA
jgi:hypothetical protein